VFAVVFSPTSTPGRAGAGRQADWRRCAGCHQATGAQALERIPIRRNRLIDQNSLKQGELEQFAVLIDRKLLWRRRPG